MKKICITGINGFIGNRLSHALAAKGKLVTGFFRNPSPNLSSNKIEYVNIADIRDKNNWEYLLKGFDCLVHCAAKNHEMSNHKNFEDFNSINAEATKDLAESAVKAGIKKFIFLSTIKVNGEITGDNDQYTAFTNEDKPNPQDVYSSSKLSAEKLLWDISNKTNLEVSIIRLPLVYGFGVKGNLKRLIKLINFGIPLPFSLINNKRSLIGIDNLVDLLIKCIESPSAANKTFLTSDGKDLSTPDLIKLIASSMGRKAYLFPFPVSLLKFLGIIFRKRNEIDRLIGSLRIDDSYTKKTLNWSPPLSVEEGIRKMIQGK